MTALGYGILAAAIVLCAAAVWCERRKTRRTLEKLNEMLTDAMRGDFTEDSFDETLLSALESKLAHYLAASTVSARNVSTEKEKLKSGAFLSPRWDAPRKAGTKLPWTPKLWSFSA